MAAVELEIHDTHAGNGWAEVVLNRPERKNAITGPLGADLAAAIIEAGATRGVNAILLRGAGGAFCSGLDLKAFNEEPVADWVADFQRIWRGAHKALFECPIPIIGAMERYAINGGAALAIACDLLVVGQESFLQVGEIQIGMAAPYNQAWLSLRHSEMVQAQLTLVGDRLSGVEMEKLGLATVCVADSEVLETGQDLARRIGGFEGDAQRKIKSGLRAGLGHSADQWFDLFTANADGVKPKRNIS
ncbi:MAG: enoyl-CoA hydratase/isomerase family protein [Pseudomonadota bacterium]